MIIHLFILAQCYINNPCELGDYFVPPKYDCYQLANSPDDAICTCPNGEARRNSRCRKEQLIKLRAFLRKNIQVFVTVSIVDLSEYVLNELFSRIRSISVDVLMVQGVMRFLAHVRALLRRQQQQLLLLLRRRRRRRRQQPL